MAASTLTPSNPVKAVSKPPGKKVATRKSSGKNLAKVASAADPYPKTLDAWLKKEEKVLLDGLTTGRDVFEIANDLGREPTSVLRQLDAVGSFEFEQGTEEQIEIYSLGLSGVPLGEAVLWCNAAPKRLRMEALNVLRKLPDPRSALEMAQRHGFWRVLAADLDDLRWLALQPDATVKAAVEACLDRFDAVTARTVRDQMSGVLPDCVDPRFWTQVAKRAKAPAAATASWTGTALNKGRSRRGKGASYSSGRKRHSRFGKSRLTKSSSVPTGKPASDTRTTAEKAWENRTHW